ncbi:uncharacterized protein MYCFIDRAFT_191519 [Pseudocercospora fijiensis CIRAD86]|uniref:RRM domain-containing protein n=1 Tax=Pseudocercospora fijiensis (strain CIRAD86) TaxID=383855 RepID=M3AJR1_PSEFD|nr:uncharacterized protein MYCFIDRAFT_191519 [Pseudocercospora fijiensis CIRAD86]EME77408.1 hypothetical protein MYCFIDRAFT_191519 [Pseudocercospora fijiensis CIRAD86]
MAYSDQVTVDKSYFDALLRRADFATCGRCHANMPRKHTSAQILGRQDAASVTISKADYDHLLLKQSLLQGGLTPDALALLISGATESKPTQHKMDSWADDYIDTPPAYANHTTSHSASHHATAWRSVPDNADFAEADSFMDEQNDVEATHSNNGAPLRTLCLSGFAAGTTYRDLVSVIKGGKLLNISMRSDRNATVTFADGAADFLAWVKRNDVYLHSKRIDFKWADRQYHLNNHIQDKLASGASRNILIRSAGEKGFTEAQIRADMEHIHNLVIIDIAFRAGNAYVSTNSVHNALFARTCMMSRTAYRGCKVEFFPDECDVPLPARATIAKSLTQAPIAKKTPFLRFLDDDITT